MKTFDRLEHFAHLATESVIAQIIVKAVLEAGYTISVDDGGDSPVRRSTDFAVIMAALGSPSEDTLVFRRADGSLAGGVFFVYGYGNEGYDVVADYHGNSAVCRLVEAASEFADHMEAAITDDGFRPHRVAELLKPYAGNSHADAYLAAYYAELSRLDGAAVNPPQVHVAHGSTPTTLPSFGDPAATHVTVFRSLRSAKK